jgi:SanA protein
MKFLKIIFIILLLPLLLVFMNYWWIAYAGNKMIVSDKKEKLKNRYVLVLGAGKEYRTGKRPNYYFNGRAKAVVNLRKTYPNCKIIISGFSDGNHYDEANDLKKELLASGVKDTLLILDSKSEDTYSSLKMYHRNFLSKPVTIVSQKAHLCRALWIAQHLNIDAVGYEAEGWPKREPNWFLMREMGARLKATLEILF